MTDFAAPLAKPCLYFQTRLSFRRPLGVIFRSNKQFFHWITIKEYHSSQI